MSTRQLDTAELTARVTAMYEEVALHPDHEFHFETGGGLAERLGYRPAELAAVPPPALASFAGVGYFLDLANLTVGERVLDLGSGSGTDSFVAAHRVGTEGRVVGVDMAPAQLAKATSLAGGMSQVEFRAGRIEEPPVEPNSVDCVISNGVINLCPDKAAVFAAAATALRRGGRLALADIVTTVQLPEGVTCDASLWAACIGGASRLEDYLDVIGSAGFEVDTVRENAGYRFLSDRALGASAAYGVMSISLLAHRS